MPPPLRAFAEYLKKLQLTLTKLMLLFRQLSRLYFEIKKLKTGYFVAMATNEWGSAWLKNIIKVILFLGFLLILNYFKSDDGETWK